jgi:hypothetical protein
MRCLVCEAGFEGGGQAEVDNLFNHYRTTHYHDMNEHTARCVVELQNKVDKLEIAVNESKARVQGETTK